MQILNQEMLIKLRQQKAVLLWRHGVKIASSILEKFIKRTSPLSDSQVDIHKRTICGNSGETWKRAVIALRKFLRSDGITTCITIALRTGQGRVTASGAGSSQMWINLIRY